MGAYLLPTAEEVAFVPTVANEVSRLITTVAVGVARLVAVILLYLGMRGNWIFCWTNCGETFDALQYLENFRLYGLKYHLVQDMATAPKLDAHPFLYTHNANLAGYVFVFLQAVGIESFAAQQLITILIFLAGLAYLGIAIERHTRSRGLAVLVLVLFCIDLEHVLSYGLNPLRAWHWVAIFGLLHHLDRWLERPRVLDLSAIVLLAAVSLGIGYDFWVICLCIAVLLALFPQQADGRPSLRRVPLIVVLFAIPVILRQAQVASVIGPDLWLSDVLYSASIKVPFLASITTLPEIATLDQKYREWNILRPPATPTTGLSELLWTFYHMSRAIVFPSFGTVTAFALATLLMAAVVVMAIALVPPRSLECR